MPLEIFIAALLTYALAAAQELRDGRIPNLFCAAIALIGLYRWFWPVIMHSPPDAWITAAWAVGVTILAFVLGTLAFSQGWIGGGAIKLMTASILLLGAPYAPGLVFLMLLMGAIVGGLFFMAARFGWAWEIGAPAARGTGGAVPRRSLKIPYGLAIALSAAILLTLQYRGG